jgi:sec-independent protein translocase protein TatA
MATSLSLFAGIMGLGAPELVIILVILLVLFGGAKLPSLAKGLGQSIKEFKKASKEDEPAQLSEAKKTETPAPTSTSTPTPGAQAR